MKTISITFILASSINLAPAALAQRWEVGGGAGGSFFTSQSVQNAAISGHAGLANGLAASFWLGNNSKGHLGGEFRYDYEHTNLQVSNSGASASFGADTHAVHYDLLLHATSSDSRVRPYVAAGAGVKMFRGVGKETAFQPLSNLALLTKTTDTTALVSVGAGVKFAIARALQLRLEIRDELTPFPKQVITPAQGAKINGWLQDFVVMAGISAIF